MTEKIICAGSGGQGIMLMGQLLAKTGLNQGLYISWFPSYGAEVRGGTAFCHVILSDKEIPSPYIQLADSAILMNAPSLLKFQKYLKKGGLLLLNSSLARKSSQRKDIKVYKIPFTEIALNLGNIKIANSVALGAYIALKKIFSKDELFKIIQEVAPRGKEELIEINRKAVIEGMRQIKK